MAAEAKIENAPPRARGAVEGLRLQRFGSDGAHLAVDFGDPCEPRLVTDVLAACARDDQERPLSHDVLWDLEVGQRIELLLRLAALDAGSGDGLDIELRCAAPNCRAFLEFTLAIPELAAGETTPSPLRHAGSDYRLRRPTARDQLAWLQRSFGDESEAVAGMAASLLDMESEPDAALIATVEETLERIDPLVRFSVRLDCPDCGLRQEREMDLAALALRRLRRAQDGLLKQVHRLARHYHWSESEILALPAWRRERYLALIDAGREGSQPS